MMLQVQRTVRLCAKACALAGGMLLGLVMVMTCASVVARNTTGVALTGDFELTGVATGMAIALFMPWCQWERSHIIVDFFTAKASAHTRDGLDRVGSLALAVCMALLAWRTALGGASAWSNQSASMLMGFPDWVVYATMVPPLALCACIGVIQALHRRALTPTGSRADPP